MSEYTLETNQQTNEETKMSNYKTPAEAAKEIRTALKKAKGITSRQVSVRSESYSMGSSIRLTIKDPSISKEWVEEIAKEQQSISRCEYSGDILSGGNRFVFVDYSREAEEALAAPHLEAVRKAFEEIQSRPEGERFDPAPITSSPREAWLTWEGSESFELYVPSEETYGHRSVWGLEGVAMTLGKILAA